MKLVSLKLEIFRVVVSQLSGARGLFHIYMIVLLLKQNIDRDYLPYVFPFQKFVTLH